MKNNNIPRCGRCGKFINVDSVHVMFSDVIGSLEYEKTEFWHQDINCNNNTKK